MTKRIIYFTLAAYALMVLTMACGKRQQKNTHSYSFTIDVINGYTPVKNQGLGRTCWIYAMLATIETDRITLGDSVNLSADYTVRRLMEEQYNRAVLTGGTEKVWTAVLHQTCYALSTCMAQCRSTAIVLQNRLTIARLTLTRWQQRPWLSPGKP